VQSWGQFSAVSGPSQTPSPQRLSLSPAGFVGRAGRVGVGGAVGSGEDVSSGESVRLQAGMNTISSTIPTIPFVRPITTSWLAVGLSLTISPRK
jgi:hypothetical protein